MKFTVIFLLILVINYSTEDLFGDSSEERSIKQEGLVNTLISKVEEHKDNTAVHHTTTEEQLQLLSLFAQITAFTSVVSTFCQLIAAAVKMYKSHVLRQARKLVIPK